MKPRIAQRTRINPPAEKKRSFIFRFNQDKIIKMSKVEDNKENYDICLLGNCATCPSYPKEAGEGLFCARGKSKAKIEKKGCNCPECPVWINSGLSGMYYCLRGVAS